jgi:methionine-rich copper-binding protein CopC
VHRRVPEKREAGVVRRLLAGLALCVLGVAIAVPAAAAGPESPRYVTSDPQDGAQVESPPSRVSATFSEPLDPSSTLHVYDECGEPVDAGDTQVLGSRMDVGIARSPSGHYTVVYTAKGFGGATGETKDDFSFHVSSGSPCGAGGHDHGGHDGHEGHGGGHEGHGGGHEGHGGGHEGHTGAGHLVHSGHAGHSAHGAGHSAHGAGHTGHAGHGAGHSGHSGHAGHAGTHSSGHAGHHHHGAGLVEPPLTSAAGRGGLAPTSQSVLVALGLSMLLGALGGWVLRVSATS